MEASRPACAQLGEQTWKRDSSSLIMLEHALQPPWRQHLLWQRAVRVIARSLDRTTRIISTALLGAALTACGSDQPVPLGPGALEATLVSPNGPEGAAVLELAGPGLGEVTVAEGEVFEQADGNTTRLVIVRDIPGQIRFRVQVIERSEPPTATVVEVADGTNELRSSISGYQVEFTPVVGSIASRTMGSW